MLTDEQRAELEGLGPEIVLMKLMKAGAGSGASVQGFKSAPATMGLTRSDVGNWLAEIRQASQVAEQPSIAARASVRHCTREWPAVQVALQPIAPAKATHACHFTSNPPRLRA
jgi:hypothetical protein